MDALLRLASGVCGLLLLGLVQARAAPDPTAECIAVMQTQADELARHVRAGETSQQPLLRAELERAAALIGRAWLDGLHDEAEARARLKQAQDAQGALSDAERANLHAACVKRADAELESASGLQRFIVGRIAQARLNRLISPQ